MLGLTIVHMYWGEIDSKIFDHDLGLINNYDKEFNRIDDFEFLEFEDLYED